MKWRYVVTVVITAHTLITNEIHNWLNRVFMSLLSPLAEPADNESETDGHLTRMGPRLIMNICLIFPGPVFSQCKVANSELLLHIHTCAQLSYWFETSSRQVFHCGGKQCSMEQETRVVTAIQTYAPGLVHVIPDIRSTGYFDSWARVFRTSGWQVQSPWLSQEWDHTINLLFTLNTMPDRSHWNMFYITNYFCWQIVWTK